ncbi:hypothetical protein VTN00DRAFT_2054 [Thermoascus crustaceus]|uniref:uncharacterized protein n=1 Tax=Thermoascus crustaceus TaxID=5088 RepID=UPI0037446917
MKNGYKRRSIWDEYKGKSVLSTVIPQLVVGVLHFPLKGFSIHSHIVLQSRYYAYLKPDETDRFVDALKPHCNRHMEKVFQDCYSSLNKELLW